MQPYLCCCTKQLHFYSYFYSGKLLFIRKEEWNKENVWTWTEQSIKLFSTTNLFLFSLGFREVCNIPCILVLCIIIRMNKTINAFSSYWVSNLNVLSDILTASCWYFVVKWNPPDALKVSAAAESGGKQIWVWDVRARGELSRYWGGENNRQSVWLLIANT